MTRNTLKHYVQSSVAIGSILGAALLFLPAIQLLADIVSGDGVLEAFERFLSLAGWMVLIVVAPFTVWGTLRQRKADMLRGISADYVGSLSWKERIDFRKKQVPLNETRPTSN